MLYRLKGIPGSPFVRKAQVFMEEKGLSCEDVFTNIFPVGDDLASVNPMRRVPVLEVVDGGQSAFIADTSAICLYLEAVHPEPALYPAEPLARARAMMYEEYADTDLAAAIGMGVFRPLVVHPMLGKPVDRERVRRVLDKKLPAIFSEFEKELAGRAHFVGEGLSIVDIAVSTQIVNLRHAGHDVDATRWPALRALVDRTLDRASFVRRIEIEKGMLPAPTPIE